MTQECSTPTLSQGVERGPCLVCGAQLAQMSARACSAPQMWDLIQSTYRARTEHVTEHINKLYF